MKTYWRIEGYDSTENIFSTKILAGKITEMGIKRILRALAAKHGLSNDEIVACYQKKTRRKKDEERTDLLEIFISSYDQKRKTTYSCGNNPHFTAKTVRE